MKNNSTPILIAGFGLMLLLLVILSVISLSSMYEINKQTDSIVNSRVAKILYLQEMRHFARERSMSILRYVLIKDFFDRDEEQQYFSSLAGKWISSKDNLVALSLDSKMQKYFDEILTTGGLVVTFQVKIFDSEASDDEYVVDEELISKVISDQDDVLKLYDLALNYQLSKSTDEINSSKSKYDDAFVLFIGLTISLSFIGLLIAFFVIKQNKKTVKEIEYYAYHDTLTNLPNRRLLLDRLKIEVAHSIRVKSFGAVLFIDIDNFKMLNDSLGHNYGDVLIKLIAQRLPQSTRSEDTVARLGGDEFVVLLPSLSNDVVKTAQFAERISEKIRIDLARSYIFDDREYHATVSIGIAIIGHEYASPDDLLRQSDTALYNAKDAGRNTVRFFDQSMQEKADIRFETERGIRDALANDQFELYYQPQINDNGALIGIEALIRWIHPDKGIISPIDFISVAEESGLILKLGDIIIDKSLSFLKSLEQQGLSQNFENLSINLSPKQFNQHDFCKNINNKIKELNIDPSLVMFEITESLILNNIEDVVRKMKLLKAMSIKFSIDDFGTGYSSLSYLQRLPLDELKIDQSFIKEMLSDKGSATIVETIITMSEKLGFSLMAEGVETASQKEFLDSLGCKNYQGYYFDKPLSEQELIKKYFNA